MVKTFEVTYRRDRNDGVWLVHVDDDDRLHTYGRTVSRARQTIREVIALWHNIDESEFELTEWIKIDNLSSIVSEARDARQRAAAAEQEALAATTKAARQLTNADVSLRDAADILGISFQRVHQLVQSGQSNA